MNHAEPNAASKQSAHRRSVLLVPALGLALAATSACAGFTREEAQEALEEVKVTSQAQALTSESIELSTHFTPGDAVESAAEELRGFLRSQLPCAEITVEKAGQATTLTVDYGKLPGDCSTRGNRFTGRHLVSIARNDNELVQVDHVWDGLSNGKVRLDGSASVEWNLEDPSRHVVHNAVWTRLSDERTGEGSGDRMQRTLAGGLAEGFSVEGNRQWQGESGQWELEIDAVEMRWVDPVPQAGTYTLDTPFGKQLSVTFQRQSDTAIEVTVAGPKRAFDFKVVTPPGDAEAPAD